MSVTYFGVLYMPFYSCAINPEKLASILPTPSQQTFLWQSFLFQCFVNTAFYMLYKNIKVKIHHIPTIC